MQTYTFDLILSRDLTDDEIESIGAWVEDGGDAPASVEGVTLSRLCGTDGTQNDVRMPKLLR